MGHEVVHANDEVNKHEQMKEEKKEAKTNKTPYHDRPYEKRADCGLQRTGEERVRSGHIKKVRRQDRFE